MKTLNWKLLGPQDIEVKAQFYEKDNKEKMTLMLYQNARTTMDAFDAQFGPFGWTCEYKDVGGQIYGRISVKDAETGEWIYKEDTGAKSNFEPEKGLASDIMKRVAVKWGYGRELYSTPKIYVNNDGYDCRGYKVSKIVYDENRRVIDLEIVNKFGKVMWTMDDEKGNTNTKKKQPEKKDNFQILREFCIAKSQEDESLNDEIKEFFEYWKKVLKEKEWKGTFDVKTLWERNHKRIVEQQARRAA